MSCPASRDAPGGRRYRAVVLGAGRMGGTIDDEVRGHPHIRVPMSHGAAYALLPEIELAGFADPVLEKAEALAARYGAPLACADPVELLERARPEIVSVCTRPGGRVPLVEAAIAAGARALYLEKPLCASMAEADRIVTLCEAAGVAFNLGTNRRFLPEWRALRTAVAGGLLGELRCLVGTCAGNALWSHTHTTDLFLLLAGDPECREVRAVCSTPAEDFADNRTEGDPAVHLARFHFEGGVEATLVSAPGWDFELHGTLGRLRTINDLATACLWQRDPEDPWRLLREVPCPPALAPGETSAAVLLVRDLVRALETGAPTLNGVRLARRSHEMAMAMVESHRRGGTAVPLPLENRELYVGRW